MLIEEKEEFSFQQKVIWAVGIMAFRGDGGSEPKSRGVRLVHSLNGIIMTLRSYSV